MRTKHHTRARRHLLVVCFSQLFCSCWLCMFFLLALLQCMDGEAIALVGAQSVAEDDNLEGMVSEVRDGVVDGVAFNTNY